MQIQISTRHGHVSDATQEKIRESRAASALFRAFDDIEMTVDLENRENSPAVDLRVAAEHKHDFVAGRRRKTCWPRWTLPSRRWSNSCASTKRKFRIAIAAPAPRQQEGHSAAHTGRAER